MPGLRSLLRPNYSSGATANAPNVRLKTHASHWPAIALCSCFFFGYYSGQPAYWIIFNLPYYSSTDLNPPLKSPLSHCQGFRMVFYRFLPKCKSLKHSPLHWGPETRRSVLNYFPKCSFRRRKETSTELMAKPIRQTKPCIQKKTVSFCSESPEIF